MRTYSSQIPSKGNIFRFAKLPMLLRTHNKSLHASYVYYDILLKILSTQVSTYVVPSTKSSVYQCKCDLPMAPLV